MLSTMILGAVILVGVSMVVAVLATYPILFVGILVVGIMFMMGKFAEAMLDELL